jgi:hypothetical protein
MDEKRYRESRICRLLGNPIVYQLVILLEAGGPPTPSKLAKLIGRQVFGDVHHFFEHPKKPFHFRFMLEPIPSLFARSIVSHYIRRPQLAADCRQDRMTPHFDLLRIIKTWKLPFASPTCTLPPSHDSRPRSFFTYPLSFRLYPLEVTSTSFLRPTVTAVFRSRARLSTTDPRPR